MSTDNSNLHDDVQLILDSSVIFCDSIREEVDGRVSLMGVYSQVIELPQSIEFPYRTPPIAFFAKINFNQLRIAKSKAEFQLSFISSDETKILAGGELPTDDDEGQIEALGPLDGDEILGASIIFYGMASRIKINGPGKMNFMVRAGEEQPTVLGSLDISVTP